MTLAVSGVSLMVGGLGAARLLAGALGAEIEIPQAWVGAAVVAIIAVSYGVGRWLARRPQQQLGTARGRPAAASASGAEASPAGVHPGSTV